MTTKRLSIGCHYSTAYQARRAHHHHLIVLERGLRPRWDGHAELPAGCHHALAHACSVLSKLWPDSAFVFGTERATPVLHKTLTAAVCTCKRVHHHRPLQHLHSTADHLSCACIRHACTFPRFCTGVSSGWAPLSYVCWDVERMYYMYVCAHDR